MSDWRKPIDLQVSPRREGSTNQDLADLLDLVCKAQSYGMENQRCEMVSKRLTTMGRSSSIVHYDKPIPRPRFGSSDGVDCRTQPSRESGSMIVKRVFSDASTKESKADKLSSRSAPSLTIPMENECKISVRAVLACGAPYSMVVLPPNGDFWLEGGQNISVIDPTKKLVFPTLQTKTFVLEQDTTASAYRTHFINSNHLNFAAVSDSLGPILMSIRYHPVTSTKATCSQVKTKDFYRVLLRLQKRTHHFIVESNDSPSNPTPNDFLKLVVTTTSSVENFQPVIYLRAPESILKFDEHVMSCTHKFGVVYQRFGQITEEEWFHNNNPSEVFVDFLNLLADKVVLKDFKGFRGGLDIRFGQTGEHSYYTKFMDREIMFHVSTLLPYCPGDEQQVQRKRHIGNDIVAIIFQDTNTPFCPSTIRSHFLHVYLVVQYENDADGGFYKVSVVSKEGTPPFGPPLPNPSIFRKGPEFRSFILSKLINAETAAMQSETFTALAERTRSSLLKELVSQVIERSTQMSDGSRPSVTMSDRDSGGGFINSLKYSLKSHGGTRDGTWETSISASKSGSDLSKKKSKSNKSKDKRNKSNMSSDEMSGETPRSSLASDSLLVVVPVLKECSSPPLPLYTRVDSKSSGSDCCYLDAASTEGFSEDPAMGMWTTELQSLSQVSLKIMQHPLEDPPKSHLRRLRSMSEVDTNSSFENELRKKLEDVTADRDHLHAQLTQSYADLDSLRERFDSLLRELTIVRRELDLMKVMVGGEDGTQV